MCSDLAVRDMCNLFASDYVRMRWYAEAERVSGRDMP